MTDSRAEWDDEDRRELLIACDGEGRITWADARAERKIGAVEGKAFCELAAPGVEEKAKSLFARSRHEKVKDCELPMRVGSAIVTILFCAKPDGRGGVLLLGTYFPDSYAIALTQVRESMHEVIDLNRQVGRQKRELERQNAELERAQAALTLQSGFEQNLIGIVSHDLRNPLSGILLSAASLLRRKDELDERTIQTVTRIQTSAHSATRLTHDLLDFTKARLGGGIPISRRSVDLQEVVRTALKEMNGTHPGREVRLQDHAATEGEWDSDRLGQVVSNLVLNALKYSLPGSPVQVAATEDGSWASICVHNEGVPIAAQLLPTLFESMRRGTNLGVDHSVGLGLFIVKHIVDAHGGNVEVESTEADGTTFTVRLPRAPGAAEPARIVRI